MSARRVSQTRSRGTGWRWSRPAGLSLVVLLLAACATPPRVAYTTDFELLDELPPGIKDGRGRFREILCAVLADHGSSLPDYMPCEQALVRVGTEPAPTGRPVWLGASARDYLVGLVPGLGWQCIRDWLDYDNAGPRHVASFGYESALIEVGGLASTTLNARQIRDSIQALPPTQQGRPLILLGYSKGVPDLLEFLVSYPETARHVVALVSVAGAVYGSPLAIDGSQDQANLLSKMPRSECEPDDAGAVASLKPEVRREWLATHTLPDHVRYYSVVSFPDPETRLSLGLKPSYRKLSKLADARNDSQLVFRDQVIPGSTVLALVNADHWAMAVPVARQHEFAASTFASRNDYPREATFEAVLRFVEEDLAASPIDATTDPRSD